MIELTRLNGHSLSVNYDHIRYVESSPDTVLTLITGEKLIVRETRAQVVALATAQRVLIVRSAFPDGLSTLIATAS